MTHKSINLSLNYKILANEEKLINLINKNTKNSNISHENKENKPHLSNKQNLFRCKLNNLTESRTNNEISYIRDKMTNKSKNNYSKNKRKTYCSIKRSKLMNLKYNNNKSYVNNRNKKELKITESKATKKDKKCKIYSQGKKCVTKMHNNSVVKTDINSSVRSSIDINHMLERFQEGQNKKQEKLEKLKKMKETKEKEECTYRPILCKKTKLINKNIKDDFITRQKKFFDAKNKKEKKLKERLLKNEKDEINKKNFILQKKLKENSSTGSVLNNSFLSEISCAKSMADIDSSISKLFEWENKRKEKIHKKKIEIKNELDKNRHIPKINKRSKSLVFNEINSKKESIFERLYKEDRIVKEKKKILADLLKPSFTPNLNLTYRQYDEYENYRENNNNNKCRIKNIELIGKISVNRNNNIKPKISKKNKSNNFEDDVINILLRKKILKNIRNKI